MGKGKKGGKASEGKEEKREGGEGKGDGKKGSGKGILAIPILVCFRCRCTCPRVFAFYVVLAVVVGGISST